mgnify:CR=1 FL=1
MIFVMLILLAFVIAEGIEINQLSREVKVLRSNNRILKERR